MRNITYKYNVGDFVVFKDKFSPSASTDLKNYVGQVAMVKECRDYNGPCYRLEGYDGFFSESCFAGLATTHVDTHCGSIECEVVTHQGPETSCDTGDSVASDETKVAPDPADESKWYRISFSAKLSADDLRAMKKCFFDAMNEAMEIYDLANLVIEEA
jgi:hypothetical protein